jgi:hypothetical protein
MSGPVLIRIARRVSVLFFLAGLVFLLTLPVQP